MAGNVNGFRQFFTAGKDHLLRSIGVETIGILAGVAFGQHIVPGRS
jgi:hypothetical protein